MSDLRSSLLLLKDRIAARDRAGINAAAMVLIGQRAPLGEQWASIATMLQHHGEHRAAIKAIETWRADEGDTPRIQFEHAAILAKAGRPGEARVLLNEVPETFPSSVGHAYVKGTLATNLGFVEEAIAALQRAVEIEPANGQAWLARAMAGPLEDAEAVHLRGAMPAFAAIETDDAAAYFYALGKLEDDRRTPDKAFAAIERGARIMAGRRPFDSAADRNRTDEAIRDWTPGALAAVRERVRPGESAGAPIFVTGLPRSGTTLVEQILASHSAVEGGAELGLMAILARDIGGLSHRALGEWQAAGGDPQALRELYEYLGQERFPGSGRFVDKTLATSRHMGLLAALFPDAPIIWLRRDPLDCAWSAYRSFFIRGVAWSWSQEWIADFFKQEDRLFEHFRRLLGEQMLVVPYGDLVDDPAGWTERITRHAGLTLEAAQLTPHRTSRAVNTNSAAQVREAIHRRGLGSAAPYRAKLGAFARRYGETA